MYELLLSNLDQTTLNNKYRYVYEIRANVVDLAWPRVCDRCMAVSISLNPTTKAPTNVTVVVNQSDGSSFPDLKTAIADIKQQFKDCGFDNDFEFMLGEDARRFLLALYEAGGFKNVFNTAEIQAAAQHLLNSAAEDVIVELETSKRDVVTIQEDGHIAVDWSEAQRYIKINQ